MTNTTSNPPKPAPYIGVGTKPKPPEHPVLKAAAVRRSGSWYWRRAVIAIGLVLGMAGFGAWLLHTTIEAEAGEVARSGADQ